jgi:hypothetical protein
MLQVKTPDSRIGWERFYQRAAAFHVGLPRHDPDIGGGRGALGRTVFHGLIFEVWLSSGSIAAITFPVKNKLN